MSDTPAQFTDMLPREPIDRIVNPLVRFLHIETASGFVLLGATLLALLLANSPWREGYLAFWQIPIGFRFGSFEVALSLQHWINDMLMAVFFFVIGLEVKREVVSGELRDLKSAALPLAAAVGGMIVPAAIYLFLQHDQPGGSGWGIPMATDIAFVVGCLTLLGARVPAGLRILLLSLAIIDDIGAILVIAIGYSAGIDFAALGLGLIGIAAILGLMKLGVRRVPVYLALALVVWTAFHASGIHATIAGVIFGLLCPTRAWVSEKRLGAILVRTQGFLTGERWGGASRRYRLLRQVERAVRRALSPLERFEIGLHPWVAFLIMPVFALANAGVPIEAAHFAHPVSLAVMFGLVLGKPLGILLFSALAVSLGLGRLPAGVSWKAMTGGGMLAGIGFTMALFISGLAVGEALIGAAKVGVLGGSLISAITGMLLLRAWLPLPAAAIGPPTGRCAPEHGR